MLYLCATNLEREIPGKSLSLSLFCPESAVGYGITELDHLQNPGLQVMKIGSNEERNTPLLLFYA